MRSVMWRLVLRSWWGHVYPAVFHHQMLLSTRLWRSQNGFCRYGRVKDWSIVPCKKHAEGNLSPFWYFINGWEGNVFFRIFQGNFEGDLLIYGVTYSDFVTLLLQLNIGCFPWRIFPNCWKIFFPKVGEFPIVRHSMYYFFLKPGKEASEMFHESWFLGPVLCSLLGNVFVGRM